MFLLFIFLRVLRVLCGSFLHSHSHSHSAERR